jgi:tetratricopeptide (TPR) repeat protein
VNQEALSPQDELRRLRSAAGAAQRSGNHDSAVDALARIAVLCPADPHAYGNLAMELAAAGRHAEAIEVFRNALRLDPENAAGHAALGHALKQQGQLEPAVAAYRRSVALAPDTLPALEALGVGLAEAGNAEEAADVFHRALLLDDRAISVHFNLGIALVNLERWNDATAEFQRCLALEPMHPDAVFNLGMIALAQNNPDEALTQFRRATGIHHEMRRRFDRNDTIMPFRLLHEHQQAEYLSARGMLSPTREMWRQTLAELWARNADRPRTEPIQVTPAERGRLSPSYNDVVYDGGPCSRLATVLNPDLDFAAIEESYFSTRPEIVVIDDLLAPQALSALRTFCLEATVFKKSFAPGYINSLLYSGFATPLLLQLTEEFRARLPRIFAPHRLHLAWGIKYDSTLRGIPLHADFAAVNVNFWITPDEANLDPESGGLIVWDKESPPNWPFHEYNVAGPRVRKFLADSGATEIRIPYRANRAVIFNSALFHETDLIRFRDAYEDRRVNITMLYGRKLRVGSESGFA